MAFRTPFISGKDSLNNQFTTEDGRTIAIPPTLLISAIGIVDDANQCVTMDAKKPGNWLIQIGLTGPELAGSHFQLIMRMAQPDFPRVDLSTAPKWMAVVAKLIQSGQIQSAHDCSEGGMLVAAAEMAFAGSIGLELDLGGIPRRTELDDLAACFAETPTRVLLEVDPDAFNDVANELTANEVPFGRVGTFTDSSRLTVRCDEHGLLVDEPLNELREIWQAPLDW